MDISKGYLRLFRQMLEWEWYDNPNVKVIFLHCLLCANTKAKKWRDITLKRGQFVTSYEKLAAANGLTNQQTRTALKSLQLTNEIEYQSTNQYTVITVKNYNLYQADNIRKSEADTPPTNKPNGGQVTTTNKDIDIYSNNIISLSNNKKNLSKNEREILKNYLLSKKRAKPIDDIDAYISLLIKNGDAEFQLERALKWQAKQEQKKQAALVEAPKINEPKESKEVTDAGFKKFKASMQKIRKGN